MGTVNQVIAGFFCLPLEDIVESDGKKVIQIKSKKGKKKIKEIKGKDKDGKDKTTYEDLPELTTVEAMRILATEADEELIDENPLVALLGTFRTVLDVDGFKIVKAVITDKAQEDCQKALGIPLIGGTEAIEILGIDHLFMGRTYEELFESLQVRFGKDYSGQYQNGVDEDGKPVMVPWVHRTTTAGESNGV